MRTYTSKYIFFIHGALFHNKILVSGNVSAHASRPNTLRHPLRHPYCRKRSCESEDHAHNIQPCNRIIHPCTDVCVQHSVHYKPLLTFNNNYPPWCTLFLRCSGIRCIFPTHTVQYISSQTLCPRYASIVFATIQLYFTFLCSPAL